MTSTSSRFADYQARENRTVGHILEDGKYKVGPVRDADAQSPAGGVSSSPPVSASQVLAASTWPFNPKIVKEVLASLVAPFLIYGLKIAIGRLSGQKNFANLLRAFAVLPSGSVRDAAVFAFGLTGAPLAVICPD